MGIASIWLVHLAADIMFLKSTSSFFSSSSPEETRIKS